MLEYAAKPFSIDNFSSHIKQRWPHPSSHALLPHPIFLKQKQLDDWSFAACEIAEQLSAANTHSEGIAKLNESLSSQTPECFSVDFAIVARGNQLSIRLIEAQAFPSVMSAMLDLEAIFHPKAQLGRRDVSARRTIMSKAITKNIKPEHIVMLDDKVLQQPTGIDFMSSLFFCSPRSFGSLYSFNKKWMHWRDEGAKSISRIYHRSIFHTLSPEQQLKMLALLEHQGLTHFNHPAWYYKVDKNSLSKIAHWSLPNVYSVEEYKHIDLSNMVLKYPNGFGGDGIFMSPSVQQVEQSPKESILQEQINYSPFYPSNVADKKLCVELRFMLINSTTEYIPITTLARATFDGNLMRYRKKKQKGEGYTVAIGLDE